MIINFISYLDPFVHSGGGEQITKTLITEGIRRGHNITRCHQNPLSRNYKSEADLNIFWDVVNCPEWGNQFNYNELLSLSRDKSYICGTGGYEELCALGTLPCSANTDGIICNIPNTHPTFGVGGINRPHPKMCQAKSRSIMYKNAKICFFASNLHKDKTEKMVGKVNSSVFIPPVNNMDSYKNMNLIRDIDILSYGGHLEYKGFFNIKSMFPNKSPIFIGGGAPDLPIKYNYGKFAGKIEQSKMPELLNRTKTFVHLPRWPEPFGITTLQAKLCGCEVIENENSTVLKNENIDEYLIEIKRWENCSPIWDKIENVKN